jgi:hypothetical protein
MGAAAELPDHALPGAIPHRIQLAGGWIDQPFVSRHNPEPPGSMVVVQIEPDFKALDRAGMATSTRAVAARIWNGCMPKRPYMELVRELYAAENEGKTDPSGSQDMIGLIYPGVNRLDYDHAANGAVFPVHVESCNDAGVARWLQSVIWLVPVAPRPEGYSPLGIKNLEPAWVAKLGQCGKDCYEAIVRRDLSALGASLNLNMQCWEVLLPHVVRHPLITTDLLGLLAKYQRDYAGAMFSGCGGGYLTVVSDRPVPGGFQVKVRLEQA